MPFQSSLAIPTDEAPSDEGIGCLGRSEEVLVLSSGFWVLSYSEREGQERRNKLDRAFK
jgi:hypothetical protein